MQGSASLTQIIIAATPGVPPSNDTPGLIDPDILTERGSLALYDAHDILYENLSFQGVGVSSGDDGGLIRMNNYNDGTVLYNITFRNCIIGTNTSDPGGNGVKIVDFGEGNVHDILFDHCHFELQPRMGFECIGRSTENGRGGQGYLRVDITNCTFDASAGEAISYDGNPGDLSGYCTVHNNIVEGAGTASPYYDYGKVFEINGPQNMTVTDNFFGCGRDGIANLQGRNATDENWTFSGNTWDNSHVPAGVTPGDAVPFYAINVIGGVTFTGDTIINTSAGWTWGYFDNCHGMDFTGSTVDGVNATNPPGTANGTSGCTWPTAI
jgi:hypothetical protein